MAVQVELVEYEAVIIVVADVAVELGMTVTATVKVTIETWTETLEVLMGSLLKVRLFVGRSTIGRSLKGGGRARHSPPIGMSLPTTHSWSFEHSCKVAQPVYLHHWSLLPSQRRVSGLLGPQEPRPAFSSGSLTAAPLTWSDSIPPARANHKAARASGTCLKIRILKPPRAVRNSGGSIR